MYGVHLKSITKILNKSNCTHWESYISTTSWGLTEKLRKKMWKIDAFLFNVVVIATA